VVVSPSGRRSDLDELAATLGSAVATASQVAWGDSNATWRLHLHDGRKVVVRRYPRGSADRAERVAAAMRVAGEAAVPVPAAHVASTADATWLVTSQVEGIVGAAWLDTTDRARTLASSMGRLRRQLVTVELPAIARPGRGRPRKPAVPLEPWLTTALDASAAVIARRPKALVFVHGDFAPINVIVDDEGGVRALLDFEYTRTGDPLEDVAWWGWVVRHHHPAIWDVAWSAFLDAAGIDAEGDGPAIKAFTLRELGSRAAASTSAASADRWVARLADAAAR
jgi:aminoglycoside phosphotransferase (APT) family kinase protein